MNGAARYLQKGKNRKKKATRLKKVQTELNFKL